MRLTIIELVELLRGQNVFNINEVAFAVLEVNGSLSVVPKGKYKNVQVSDFNNLKANKASLPLPVISDGKIVKETVSLLDVTEQQIKKLSGEDNISNIFLMTLDSSGNKTVVLKEKS